MPPGYRAMLAARRRWTKIERGFYRLEGTRYAVQSDGWLPVSQRERDGDGIMAGVTGGEWAVIRYTDRDLELERTGGGENLDWKSTMREARAMAERLAEREGEIA